MSASEKLPRVAVVIINWNGGSDTAEAYRSLCASSYANWRLVIVDNASTDGSVALLEKLGPRVELIANPVNAGFSEGCNIALRSLTDEDEFVFLLNNDAAVRKDTISELVRAAAELGDAVLGCCVYYRDGGALQFFGSQSSRRGDPHWFTWPEDRGRLEHRFIDSDFIFGAALFAPLRIFRQVGLFDERFFLTYEETDWCYRARAEGFRCVVVRDAAVDHVGSATMGSSQSGLQLYFLSRNRILFHERHSGAKMVARAMASLAVKALIAGFSELTGKRRQRARPRFLALRDYVLRRFGNCPGSLRTRRLGQSPPGQVGFQAPGGLPSDDCATGRSG